MLFLAKRVAGDLDVWLPDHLTNAAANKMHLALPDAMMLFQGISAMQSILT